MIYLQIGLLPLTPGESVLKVSGLFSLLPNGEKVA